MSKSPKAEVVLYLGAGASHFAGYKTFVDFPSLLFDNNLRELEGMPNLSKNPERILCAIKESLVRNNTPTTHDNFLWRLDGYNQFLRLNQCDDALQDFLRNSNRLYDLHICTQQAIQQITATTIHHYSLNRVEKAKRSYNLLYQSMKRVYSIYSAIAELNGNKPFLPVFTTNYDMLIEDLHAEFCDQSKHSFSLVNGIPGLFDEEAKWNTDVYNKRIMSGIHLYRLHGCVCWFYHQPGDSHIYFHRRNATEQETVRMRAMYPGNQSEIGSPPYGHAFIKFYRYLQVCKLIIFVGFSFRDDDVMHVLLKALEERKGKLKLLIIDPLYRSHDVVRKLEDAAQRTMFPYYFPKDSEIESITMPFGQSEDTDSKIVEACKRILI